MFNFLFGQKETSNNSYDDFWNWFQKNEKNFFNVIKNNDDIEEKFLNKISPKLDELKDGFWMLAGMYDENTAELVITADGYAKNIVFVEELINKAPQLKGWKGSPRREKFSSHLAYLLCAERPLGVMVTRIVRI